MKTNRIISLVALAGALVAGSPAGAQERERLVAPYLWGAATSLDVLIRDDTALGGDLSWNASALLGYRFGDNGKYNVLLGYRHLSVEYEESDQGLPVEVDVTMSGPQVAFAFVF
jgi:hypothetical protein